MDKDTRKNELFADAMSNLLKDKLGISIDLLNEIIEVDIQSLVPYLISRRVDLSSSCCRRDVASTSASP